MKRFTILLLICSLLLTGCSQKQEPQQEQAPQQETETVQPPPVEVPETPPAEETRPAPEPEPESQLTGELLSPDGRFAVSVAGTGNLYANGLSAPEYLRVTDAESGEVLWETEGALFQKAQWSADGRYMLLVYGGRTWNQILILHTGTWTHWQFTLPDGSIIPDYDFLPEEDWYRWIEKDCLTVTVGRGGDAGEQRVYQCSLFLRDDQLEGYVLEQTSAPLEGGYDFNQDGTAEAMQIVTVWNPEITDQAEWYELQLWQDGALLWREEAAESHVGWNSLFALRMDGEDLLLRYNPYMGQGYATYRFALFALGENGEEVVLHEESVEFDVNFGSSIHHVFEPADIADFLWAAKTLTDGSRLLLSTEGGTFVCDADGTEFDAPWLSEEMAQAKSSDELEQLLRDMEVELTEERLGVTTWEEIKGEFDFNHNGIPEKVWLVTQVLEGSGGSFWRLEVAELNKTLWSDSAHAAHAGWNSLFACRIDDEDYLLRYHPTMYQGNCTYEYTVFSLDAAGKEFPLKKDSVVFDINWNSPVHELDAEALTAFVEELNETLEGGRLLLNTDDALTGMDPEAPRETLAWLSWEDLCPGFRYQKGRTLGENLNALENAMRAAGAVKR